MIIGTALAALGNNNGCGCGGNGMIDLFVDKDGNINAPLIADALKSELKARGGFTIGRVKFSDSDVDELLTAFNQAKQKNR